MILGLEVRKNVKKKPLKGSEFTREKKKSYFGPIFHTQKSTNLYI